MAINFKTDQNGLYQDPLNGAIIKGDGNNTFTTYKFINDDTFAGDAYGNLYHIPSGSTDVSMPGQTVFEIPANKNNKMNTLQKGGAASQDQQQQIIMQVAQMLQQGADPQEVMKQLVSAGIPAKDAEQLVAGVIQQLQQMMAQQQQQGGGPEEQEAMMGQQDQENPQEQEMAGQGMMEEGGQPCFDCFDHYNPSPQAQNLNWFYKAQGGQAFNEAFPQAQTYMPYDRPGETRPNFMFEMGGQSDIDKAYQIMKKGGMDHNPKKKKKGKFNHLSEFQKYLKEGGGLNTYAGGGYTIPGSKDKKTYDYDNGEWIAYDENGNETTITDDEMGMLDKAYPGGNKSNNQGATNNQGTANQGAGTASGTDPYGFYNNYLQGQNMGNLLGPKGAAAFSLMQGIFGSGAGLGMGLGMGRSKFKGKIPGQGKRGLGDRWDFNLRNKAADDAVPEYFQTIRSMYGNQGAGTTNQGSTSTTNTTNTNTTTNNNTNNTQGPGAGGTNPNTGNTSPNKLQDSMTPEEQFQAMQNNQQGFDFSKYNNMNRAMKHYYRGMNDQNYRGKGWKDADNIPGMTDMYGDLKFNEGRYNNKRKALKDYQEGISEGDYGGKGWDVKHNPYNDDPNSKYSTMLGDSQFNAFKYNNMNRALRHYNRGINDTEIDPLNPMGGLQGRGWEGAREQKRNNLLDQMGKDMTFNSYLYHSKDRALRHWLQGTNVENPDFSGKGWGRRERSSTPDYDYYPDDVYRRDGGMTQYKPGGMWNNDHDWKYTFYTPTNPYKTFAIQSGLNSAIDQKNAYLQNKEKLENSSTVNMTPYAPSAGKSMNYLGTLNARGYNPDRTAQPGNFATDAYFPRLLRNTTARSGGSILDYYEDGAEVDLDNMTPEERDNFIRAVYEAGGSVEFI